VESVPDSLGGIAAIRLLIRSSLLPADADGRLADQTGDDLPAIVLLNEHELAALRLGALDGENHGRLRKRLVLILTGSAEISRRKTPFPICTSESFFGIPTFAREVRVRQPHACATCPD
jgi:hypothetical protein